MANFDLRISKTVQLIFTKLEISNYFPKTTRYARPHTAASTWVVWANTQFATVSFFPRLFWFLHHAPRSNRLTDLHQNRHESAVPAKNVPFGDLDDDQSSLEVQTPKSQNFWGVNRHFKQNLQKNQIKSSFFKTMHRISIKFDIPM